MTQSSRMLLGGVVLSVLAGGASGAGKDRYTLFDPTPRSAMREMSTDRPDTTESPYTVDAGHFQAELSLVDFTHDRSHGVTTDTLVALPSNLKVGLLNNVDLQLVVDPYVNTRSGSARRDGFGETQVRLKVNLLGNDEGDVALGVMGFVKFPTGTDGIGNDHYEGGIMFPVALSLPAGFDLAAMLEVDWVRDAGDGYGWAIVHTVEVGHNIVGDLDGYLEYAGASFEGAGEMYRAVIGCGVTYRVSADLQLDAGANFGISESADDFNVFVGMSVRK